MLKVTLANVRGHLVRLLLTGLAVMLGTAFVAGSFVLTDSIDETFSAIFATSDSTDAVVRLSEDSQAGGLDLALADELEEVDEVVAMANDSHYGLAAYVWSADLDEALTTANRIQSGWVQVNQGGGQVVGQSYGGYKESGIGREFSIEGAIEGFTQTKQINVKLNG